MTKKSGIKGKSAETDLPGSAPATPYMVRDPEAFARNIARAIEQAGKAASAWVEPREQGRAQDDMSENVTDIANVLGKVGEYWLSDPQRALYAQTSLFGRYMDLWNSSIRTMAGEETTVEINPEKGDRRFNDSEWDENQFFNFLKQTYLITSDWAKNLVEETEGLDEHTKHKAAFYTQQLVNSLSPSNFPMTNPQVLRETFESDGQNLVNGMKMLAEDIVAGDGELRLRQADNTAFTVGKDVANTPGKVVAENDVCQLIQYTPTTKKVLKRPLLIVPPWINKFYILDLNPEKSFIRWCVEQGHTVFVISWVNPDEKQAGKSFEHYGREGILNALDVIADITGSTSAIREGRYKDVNMMGAACIMAVINALPQSSFPYVFGGDGATLAVPESALALVRRELGATRKLSDRKSVV